MFGDIRHHPDHVVQIDDVAGFDVPGDRLAANAGETDLALWIVGVNVVHVERDLTMDAHGLNLRDLHRPRAFQHVDTLGSNAHLMPEPVRVFRESTSTQARP